MATYSEITSTKTITLDADGGTKTLTYYAGNKNNTTGSVVGNANAKTITYQFDTAISWISSVSFTNKDDTAKNITVTYSKNESTSSRQVNFKLKDLTSLYYLILKLNGKPDTYNGTDLWLALFTLIDYADVYQNLDINKQAIDKIYIYPGDKSYGCALQKVLDANEIDMFTFDLNKQKNTLNTAYGSNCENNNNHFSNNIINGESSASVHINLETDADMKGKYIVFSNTYTGSVYMNQLYYNHNNTQTSHVFKNMVSQDLTNGGFKLRISFNSTLANSNFGITNKTVRVYASLDAVCAYNLNTGDNYLTDTYNIFYSYSSEFSKLTYNPRAYKDFPITGTVGNQICDIYVPIDFESYDILSSLTVYLFLCLNTDISSINYYGYDSLPNIPL